MNRFEHHFSVSESGQTLLDLLAANTELSKQKLKDALAKGCVWLTLGKRTQRIRRAKKVIAASSEIHIYYDPQILNTAIPEPTLVTDAQEYSVWNKPCGLLSQGSKWGDHSTITRWAEKHLTPQRNAFVVHRLDRAASGLIVIAHSKQMAAELSRLFAERQIQKQYHASVAGQWPHSESITVREPIDNKEAISHIELVEQKADRALLQVTIETGRKHQIRRHLSQLKFPILGDRLYGDPNAVSDLQLTAVTLSFHCPIAQQPVTFSLL